MKSFSFKSNGQELTVYAISTGTVAMKTRAHTIRRNHLLGRIIDVIKDKEFTDALPVYCWLIKHPEGMILIDTGYSSQINDPGYLKKASPLEKWFTRTQVRANVKPQDELVAQLALLGVGLNDIHFTVLTHLHVDHVGGIPDMKGVKFIVNETELKNNSQSFLLPEWFKPERISFDDAAMGPFEKSYSLTAAGDMQLVYTPGHTKGHCSVLLKTDEVDLLFAGDVMYSADQLDNNAIAIPNHRKTSLQSYADIKNYAKRRPLIVLPSHDVNSLQRLERPLENIVSRLAIA